MLKKYKILPLIIFFFLAFTPPLNPPAGGWTQQFMPNLGGRQISDIFFLDSVTGWAVTPYLAVNDTAYVLKTTNGGDNWFIQHTRVGQFVGSNRVAFLNANTGYTAGVSWLPTYSAILKTTNGGSNWNNVNPPTNPFTAKDISILNENTIWAVSDNSLTGGVYRTTNGGANWDRQFSGGNQNPNKIYMYNERIGFISNSSASPNIYKTTNGGDNWTVNVSGERYFDISFADSLTGWRSSVIGNTIFKTTNGGINWITQIIPSGGIIITAIGKFSVLNKDTVWGVGGLVSYGSNGSRGILYRTTNGGINWLFQLPDTSIHITGYAFVQFINRNTGWAYHSSQGGIHTITGGDTSWLTDIKQISHEIPANFKLYQNYPNPFNPRTVIKYEVRSQKSEVRLVVYDINGREIIALVNQEQDQGIYEVDFSGDGLSSGVYFYKITITNRKEVFIDTKKMILIK